MTTREALNSFNREEGIALYNAKKTDKEIYDILVSKGLTDDFETFKAETQNIFTEKVSAMSKDEILAQIEGAELTDKQLEMIAGGKDEKGPDWGAVTGSPVGDGALLGAAGTLLSASAAGAI